MKAPISIIQMKALGWSRIEGSPPRWQHQDGWKLQRRRVGWDLLDAKGRLHNEHGRTWGSLRMATEFVRSRGAMAIEAMDRV